MKDDTEEEYQEVPDSQEYQVEYQQTPVEEIANPQPKTNGTKGKIRGWVKEKYQEFKEQRASVSPEQKKAMREEKMAQIKGFFTDKNPAPQAQKRPLDMNTIMGDMFGGQQGSTQNQARPANMQTIMGDMFGTNQAPPPRRMNSRARQRLPPARAPIAQRAPAEPRYNTSQVIDSMFSMGPPRRVLSRKTKRGAGRNTMKSPLSTMRWY